MSELIKTLFGDKEEIDIDRPLVRRVVSALDVSLASLKCIETQSQEKSTIKYASEMHETLLKMVKGEGETNG